MIKIAAIDLDGTVYKGNQLIENSQEAIENLEQQNVKIYYCSNNSSNSVKTIYNRLIGMGIECDEDAIITSGLLMMEYLKKNNLENNYLIGTEEYKKYLLDNHINIVDYKDSENLIIGMVPNYTYDTIKTGMNVALKVKKILLCNEDRHYAKEDGLYPGCGALTSSILYCSNKTPTMVVGKPNILMMEHIKRLNNCKKEEMIVIGDSIETDIAMANNFGCKSLLVSSAHNSGTITFGSTKGWNWSLFNNDHENN